MPYNIIIEESGSRRIEHATSAREAADMAEQHAEGGGEIRIVSTEGVEISTDRLRFLAQLEDGRRPAPHSAAA